MRSDLAIYGDGLSLGADKKSSGLWTPAFSFFMFIYPLLVIPERLFSLTKSGGMRPAAAGGTAVLRA